MIKINIVCKYVLENILLKQAFDLCTNKKYLHLNSFQLIAIWQLIPLVKCIELHSVTTGKLSFGHAIDITS